MNPSDANSSLATLRQLKEMLDASTLTPQEFETLKQKLIFGKNSAAEAPEPVASSAFVPPVSVAEALTSAHGGLPGDDSLPISPVELPNWQAETAAPVMVESAPSQVLENEEADYVANDSDTRRNPLNLVFAIGGALVFLAVVLYLTLGNRGTDEHLTSTTQTAADSARVAPEVGPQVQQLTLPSAAPETVRVAPATPAVAAPVAATPARTDSAAALAPAVAAPAASTKPVGKPKPAPGPTLAADSAI